jgi:hypothetical protein
MGVGMCIARAALAIMAAQSSRASAKWENTREARENMNGTWRCSRRELDAHIVERGVKKKKKVAESQRMEHAVSTKRGCAARTA